MEIKFKNSEYIFEGNAEGVWVDGVQVGTFFTAEEGWACFYLDGIITEEDYFNVDFNKDKKKIISYGDLSYNTAKRKLRTLLKAFA